MFTKKNDDPDAVSLQDQIDLVHAELSDHLASEDVFETILNKLERLYALRELEKAPKRVNVNTLITVGASMASVVGVILFERNGVFTTKALDVGARLFKK